MGLQMLEAIFVKVMVRVGKLTVYLDKIPRRLHRNNYVRLKDNYFE